MVDKLANKFEVVCKLKGVLTPPLRGDCVKELTTEPNKDMMSQLERQY